MNKAMAVVPAMALRWERVPIEQTQSPVSATVTLTDSSHQDAHCIHNPDGFLELLSETPAHNFEVVRPEGSAIERTRHIHEKFDLLLREDDNAFRL